MQSHLKIFFPEINDKQLNQFDKLAEVFPVWNSKINLVSRKDIDQLFVRHILHSLSIAKIYNFEAGTNIIDIGTGGGFPGIPLAIMFPETKFDLVDSIGKKIVAVNGIAEELGLTNVKGIKSRAELLPAKYDYVVSRAVTAFPSFYEIARNLFKKDNKITDRGIIYLKGCDFDDEIKPFSNVKVFKIIDLFDFDFFETKKIIYLPIKSKKL